MVAFTYMVAFTLVYIVVMDRTGVVRTVGIAVVVFVYPVVQ